MNRPKQLNLKGMPARAPKSTSLYSKAHWPATDKQIDTIMRMRRALRMYNNKDLETISRTQASEEIRRLSGMLKQEKK